MSTWQTNPDLMDRLTKAQNSINAPIDIMTFAAFCESREQLLAHVESYEAQATFDTGRESGGRRRLSRA